MLVYKDLETGDELFSETFCPTLSECKTFYKFDSKLTEQRTDGIDGALIGANASAEEAQEETEAHVVSGLDFALASKLEPFDFGSKKTFLAFLKDYFGKQKVKVEKENDEEKLAAFQENVKSYSKLLLSRYKDAEFFFGENDTAKDNSFCAAIWNDDGRSATVYCYAGAIVAEKY